MEKRRKISDFAPDAAEMGDVSAAVLAHDWQSHIEALASERAPDALVRHHQCLSLLSHLGNELGDLSQTRFGPPLPADSPRSPPPSSSTSWVR